MDYHNILGVDRGASEEELKRAFHQRALERHPDKGGTNEEMRALRTAFDILRSRGRRGAEARGEDYIPGPPLKGAQIAQKIRSVWLVETSPEDA